MRSTLRAAVFAIACTVVVPSSTDGQVTVPVIFDPDMTVGAGATVSVILGAAAANAEHAIVPDRVLTERGLARRTANIAYRWLKLAYFDLPQEQLLLVVNHELFGHGARLRERFDGQIEYRVDVPEPYGAGGGATFFTFDREPTVHELLSVSAAGMEGNRVAASLISHQAFREGRMNQRDALRYLGFELDTMNYVLNTDDEPEREGHDVSGFIQVYNEMAEFIGARRVTPRELQREVLVCLANPMLGYALFGIARYVWNGNPEVPVPAVSIAGIRYLPLLRYQLTPYGTEWSLMNELGGRIQSTQVELRVGRSPGARPWGIGIREREVALWRGWRLDIGIEVWRQPRIVDTITASTASESRAAADARLRLGGQVSGRAERPLGARLFGLAPTVIVDLGVKTAGFVPGEPLRAGGIVRAGVGIPFGH
jgi:hypothetical protein